MPAFSGLFAPYWRDDARGVIVGLTAYANRGHIARAALEATAWQIREVVDAANAVADVPFTELRVDGGMTANELLMQFQADVLGVPVIRPTVDRDDRARRRLRRRPGRRASGRTRTSCASAGPRTSAGSRRWTTRTRERAVRALEEGGQPLARLGRP